MKISGPAAKMEQEGTPAKQDKSENVESKQQQGQGVFRQKKAAVNTRLPVNGRKYSGHIPGEWKTGTSMFLLGFILVTVWLDISFQSISLLLLFLALLWVLDARTTIGDFEKLNKIRYEAELANERNETAETA